jgi:hypothetical protein
MRTNSEAVQCPNYMANRNVQQVAESLRLAEQIPVQNDEERERERTN